MSKTNKRKYGLEFFARIRKPAISATSSLLRMPNFTRNGLTGITIPNGDCLASMSYIYQRMLSGK